jgi:hypothetical protein
MLAHASEELREERRVLAATREELRGKLAASEQARQQLENELATERREGNEKVAGVQSYIGTLREQYALAAAERDASSREAAMQRQRADDAVAALARARVEFARALDEEHRQAMELLSRAWSYVNDYPRMPDWWSRATLAERPAPRKSEDAETRIEVERDADRVRAQQAETPPAGAPVVPPAAREHYDIEAELADAVGEDLQRAAARTRRARKPVGTVRQNDEVLVVCDDGSVWKKTELGWRESPPIPGSATSAGARRSESIEHAG